MSDNYFEKDISGAYPNTNVRVVSIDKERHLNIVVTANNLDRIGVTLNRQGVLALRDTLNELHPPPAAEPEQHPYEVKGPYMNIGHAPWRIVHKVMPTELEERTVGEAYTEEAAKRIAQALNEAEGL